MSEFDLAKALGGNLAPVAWGKLQRRPPRPVRRSRSGHKIARRGLEGYTLEN